MNKTLNVRKFKDRAFKYICLTMVLLAFLFMAIFILTISINSYKALWNYSLDLDVQKTIAGTSENNLQHSFNALYDSFKIEKKDREKVFISLFSNRADAEYKEAVAGGKAVAQLTISSRFYNFLKNVGDPQGSVGKFLVKAQEKGLIKSHFSPALLVNQESRDPEFAGIKTAFCGSLITISLALVISIPLALFSAVYLEEMSRKNSYFIFLIKTNIANLASVPSVVYGIIGLAIYIEYFDLPRSSGLVGGLTLMLMSVPSLIITYSSALQTIPGFVRDSAVALGLSKQQMIFHHIVPYSISGMVTGTMVVLARILGETAPLLMIGMAAFIVDIPKSILDPVTVLPMQIYLWSDSPESEFIVKSSGAIIILLLILMVIGLAALKIRSKYTIKW